MPDWLQVTDKFTGEEIGRLPAAGAKEVDVAVRRALAAFPSWSTTPAHRRAAILLKAAALIDERRDRFTETIAREAGKAWKHAANEVGRSVETFTFAGEEAKRIHGETVPMDASVFGENRIGFYLRAPLGVVSAITPFNFPLNLVAHKVAPALAAGNTVVLKPAEETPLTAVLMADCLREAGLPDGVLELVHGDGPVTGEALVRHPLPAKVSFTGSPPVGAHILQHAGLKRVTLELGNNSGTIVEPDANLDAAVPRCVMSAFANAGQVCISLQRLYVHEGIATAFMERFLAETRALKVGNPLDRDCDVGPMISDEAAERAGRVDLRSGRRGRDAARGWPPRGPSGVACRAHRHAAGDEGDVSRGLRARWFRSCSTRTSRTRCGCWAIRPTACRPGSTRRTCARRSVPSRRWTWAASWSTTRRFSAWITCRMAATA